MEAPESDNSPRWPANIIDIICKQYCNTLTDISGPANHNCFFTSTRICFLLIPSSWYLSLSLLSIFSSQTWMDELLEFGLWSSSISILFFGQMEKVRTRNAFFLWRGKWQNLKLFEIAQDLIMIRLDHIFTWYCILIYL